MTVWLDAIPGALGFKETKDPLTVTWLLVTPDVSVAVQVGSVAPEGKGVMLTVFDVPFVSDAPLSTIWVNVAAGGTDDPEQVCSTSSRGLPLKSNCAFANQFR